MPLDKNSNISFFMPAYNCEKTIRESVESIMNGNFEPGDELVIVNDAAVDGTQNILDELKNKYPQIKVLTHSRNKGGGAARNTAIENTRYEILFCLDSDNILVPGSIKRLKEYMFEKDADVVAFQEIHFFIDNPENFTHKWTFNSGIITLADYVRSPMSFGASGNYMFKKDNWLKAGGYPQFASALDTWGFGFYQLANDSKVLIMPDSYYLHRHGYSSYWIRESKKGKLSLTALQIILPYLDLFDEACINAIMSSDARYKWFDNPDKYPLVLKVKN